MTVLTPEMEKELLAQQVSNYIDAKISRQDFPRIMVHGTFEDKNIKMAWDELEDLRQQANVYLEQAKFFGDLSGLTPHEAMLQIHQVAPLGVRYSAFDEKLRALTITSEPPKKEPEPKKKFLQCPEHGNVMVPDTHPGTMVCTVVGCVVQYRKKAET